MNKVYEIITDRIVKELERGVIPWRKPWAGSPKINFVSRKAYRGINVFLLDRPGEYLTWKQIQTLGGRVKKGANSYLVTFYKLLEKTEETMSSEGKTEEVTKQIPLLRYYKVFHLDDVKGIDSKIITPNEHIPEHNPIEEAEKIIYNYNNKPLIKIHSSNRAYYSPAKDQVVVPKKEQFQSINEYYLVFFHELAHSTGHTKRLNRKDLYSSGFGSYRYSREELVAELAAAMLSGTCGIDTESTIKNNAAYINSWLRVLKNDVRLVVKASSQAQKAADYILIGEVKNVEISA